MKKINPLQILLVAVLMLALPACQPKTPPQETSTPTSKSPSSSPGLTVTLTPTPLTASSEEEVPPPDQGACDRLAGEIEVQLTLPYAEAAELDPIARGTLPLRIDPETHQVQGQGHISYDKMNTWIFEDGKETAEVFLELDLQVDGKCVEEASGGELQLTLVAVHMEEHGGTTCGYPPGECKDAPVMGPEQQSFALSFPLEDGAALEEEDWTSWTFTLHLIDH